MGAVSSAQDNTWVAVLGPLYEAVKAARPGSLEEQIAERALDYAINALASDPQHASRSVAFVVHDHLRNARHNAIRAVRREALGVQKLVAATTGSGATRVLGPIEHRGPEDHAVASDFLERLHSGVSGDARAAAVLDGMLGELPPTLISSASKVPLRSVERLRARIRAVATDLAAA
ncbi:MAG TPA: hypothetical protein VKV02_06280 [Acidobacteriaceae bacterium]|nr:hypothetical protein [Acidobacteriaceae bacterium]